jgi:hypothetical protein
MYKEEQSLEAVRRKTARYNVLTLTHLDNPEPSRCRANCNTEASQGQILALAWPFSVRKALIFVY